MEYMNRVDKDGDVIPDYVTDEQWELYKPRYKEYHQDYSRSEYIKSISSTQVDFTDQINYPIINKTYDRPLLEFIVDAFKAFEIIGPVEFEGYDYTEAESEINEDRYILHRGKGWKKTVVVDNRKRKKNVHDYKEIDDSRCGLLTLHYVVSMEEPDKKDAGKMILKKNHVNVNILVPIEDDEGYCQLKGKRKYLIYQLTEKSTYTTMGAVTLKSIMPVYVKRVPKDAVDIDGIDHKLPCYILRVFDKDHPIVLFFLANGFDYAMTELNTSPIIFVRESYTEEEKSTHVIFKVGAKAYLLVNRYMYDKYTYVKSVVGGILSVFTSHMTIASIYDANNYIKRIGGNNVGKGKNTLVYFHRLLDDTTKKIVKIDSMYTISIYHMLVYIMQNFNQLRQKDNLSLDHKRLRRNEVVSAMLSTDISKRIGNIIKKGNRMSMKDITDGMKIPGNILIQKMNNSNLFRHDDVINDNQALMKLGYTIKGPNSVGGKNSNKISKSIRGIHPSYLGHIDILHCGNSDPGTSGILNPFTDMKSLYFDDTPEPDDFLFEYIEDLKYVSENLYGTLYLIPNYDSKKEFYSIHQKIRECEEGLFYTSIAPIGGFLDEEETQTDINDNQVDDTNKEKESTVEISEDMTYEEE